jgi:uncharacterized protein YacL
MSARPFWVIFTICIIILIEWLVVPRVIDTVITREIVSARDMTIQKALDYLPDVPAGVGEPEDGRKQGVDMGKLPKDWNVPVTDEELRHFDLTAKWRIMYAYERQNGILYAAGLSVVGILAGILLASVAFRHLVRFGDRLGQLSTTDKIAIFLGLLLGLLISAILLPLVTGGAQKNPVGTAVGGVVIVYLCIMGMMSMKEEIKYYFPGLARSGEADRAFQQPKILDTNVIIDGRVADVCRTGFIEGTIYVPSFVLEELQHIADSPDPLRRARGRRGLDILNQLRKELDLSVRQSDPVDPANSEEVDVRLVKLAKELDAGIVTNDFNLNKVAELQGVAVLNINELANALKPVVLPGEEMEVTVIKEGKEASQGIAYLDDGTMVVVEGARRHIGETLDVVVASVLQTVAGKMIFANLKAVQEEEDNLIDRNVRNYSGFRPRKKIR